MQVKWFAIPLAAAAMFGAAAPAVAAEATGRVMYVDADNRTVVLHTLGRMTVAASVDLADIGPGQNVMVTYDGSDISALALADPRPITVVPPPPPQAVRP